MNDTRHTSGAARGVERRTMVRGAAWSVPVIAAAAAAPAQAASCTNPTTVTPVTAPLPTTQAKAEGEWIVPAGDEG